MQKRYPHFLRRVKGDKMPARLIAIEVVSRDGPVMGRHRTVREQLASWHASGVELSAGKPGKVWDGAGVTADELWRHVEWASKRPGVTWVVSFGAARVWALLGIWEMIEAGLLLLTMEDDDNAGERSQNDDLSAVQDPTAQRGCDGGNATHAVLRGMQGDSAPAQKKPSGVHSASKRFEGIAILEDPPSVLDVRQPGRSGRLRIVDVRNYGIGTLRGADGPEQASRQLRDTMIRMITLVRENGWGSLSPTVGGQAYHTFRRTYLDSTICCHCNPAALEIEGAAYYGGRCEARRIGRVAGPIYQYDFRALYPSVCLSADLPALLGRVADGPPAFAWTQPGAQFQVIGDVQICTSEPAYPCRREYGTIWPGGTWRACLAGPELADAERHGKIVHWYRHSLYSGAPVLDRYMRDVYDQLSKHRSSGDDEIVQWLKALLVCCPGKFGQRGVSFVNDPTMRPRAPWSQWWHRDADGAVYRYRSLGWQCQREVKQSWAPDAVPSIAAWITSAGRVKLLEVIRSAGWENVYYHDTDSVFVNEQGHRNLDSRGHIGIGDIGRLRFIGRYDYAEFSGVKQYRVDDKLVCSGKPVGGGDGGVGRDSYWFRDRIKGQLGRGIRPEAVKQLREWRRESRYRHGVVRDDGVVDPIWLEE